MDGLRLAVVGTGLIGASVGLAAKAAGVERVAGWDADPEALAVAAERGFRVMRLFTPAAQARARRTRRAALRRDEVLVLQFLQERL
jgi:threonine dehydrogenase-like Zn-dependent dehydrogenase